MINSSENQQTSSRQRVILRAGMGCFIASGTVAALMIALQGGFGTGDLGSFLFWSLPLAAGVAVVNISLMRLFCCLSAFIGYFVAALTGAMVGLIWTTFVALIFGPWFGAFSFPVLFCWMAGGASGMIFGSGACKEMNKGHWAVEVALIVSICLFAGIGAKPLAVLLSGDQKLEVLFVEWSPGPEPLSVKELAGSGLTDKELAQLKSIGLTGKLMIVGRSVYGRGDYSRAVIVMNRQVDEPVELAQPDKAEVMYIQHENGWGVYPTDAPTLKRKIGLEPSKQDPDDTMVWVELFNGARQGGLAFSW